MRSVKILLKEYEMLREEVLESFRTRNQIISYGLATIVFIFGGAAAILNNLVPSFYPVAYFLLFCILPVFVIVLLYCLLNEIEKVQIIGNHILNIEKDVNDLAGKQILTWEKKLREHPLPFYSYVAVLILFTFIALSPVILIEFISEFKFWYGIFSIILILFFYLHSATKIHKRLKKDYKIIYMPNN